jgi:hypothetical protein
VFASQVVFYHSRLRIALQRWSDHERRQGRTGRAVELEELSGLFDNYSLQFREDADETHACWDNLRRTRATPAD